MNNHEPVIVKLFQGGRPFGASLDILKRLSNKIPNDLSILPEETLLNYEMSLMIFMQLHEEIIANGLVLTEEDLNIFYTLPLFVDNAFVNLWEKEKIWKSSSVKPEVLAAYDDYIEDKTPSIAYMPAKNTWYKSVWNNFFQNKPEMINEILIYSFATLREYRSKRPVFYSDKAYANIIDICNTINATEGNVLILLNALFNFKLPHVNALMKRFLDVVNYNDGKVFSVLNNIFSKFNIANTDIVTCFSSDSLLVKAGLTELIEIQNIDYAFNFKGQEQQVLLWEHLSGKTLNIIGSKPHKNIISAVVGSFEEKQKGDDFRMPLSSWNYIEILEECSLKLKLKESLKILISGNAGTGKTSMAYSLLKEEGYDVFYLSEKDNRRNNAASIVAALSCIENAALIIESVEDIDMKAISISEIPVIVINNKQHSEKSVSVHDEFLFDYTVDVSKVPFKVRMDYAKSKIKEENLAMRVAQQIKTFGDINKVARLVKTEIDWDKLNRHIVTYNNESNDFCSVVEYEDLKDIPDFKGYEHINNYFNIIYDLFKNPLKYESLSASAPKGFIIAGTPGTGKTLFVKQIAKKTKLPMISVQTSLLVKNKDKIREVFEMAQASAPCILFFDEIDSLLINPVSPYGAIDTEKQSILNCMLSEIDGIKNLSGVIVLGTTNHVDKIAEAAKRSGRLSETIEIDLPSLEDRKAIWSNYLEGKSINEQFDVESLAVSTAGFSGADISEAVNQACLYAVSENTGDLLFKHIDKACEVILWGRGDKKLDLSEQSLWKTSVHETGHAMLALKYGKKVNRVTIIPRQRALGVTHILHNENDFSKTKKSLGEEIEIFIAGIMAEKTIFGEYESGGSSDIKAITNMVQNYFLKCGFSKTIGFMNVSDLDLWSEKKKIAFEEECHEFINNCAENVEKWLKDNVKLLTGLSQELLDKKSLSFHQLNEWEEKLKKVKDK